MEQRTAPTALGPKPLKDLIVGGAGFVAPVSKLRPSLEWFTERQPAGCRCLGRYIAKRCNYGKYGF